ncbi:MAG: hypothetical protein Kow0069_24580 [Promethearchaeota archaeon]
MGFVSTEEVAETTSVLSVGCIDHRLHLFDAATGHQVQEIQFGGWVRACHFCDLTGDGNSELVAGGGDKTLRAFYFDPTEKRFVEMFSTTHENNVEGVAAGDLDGDGTVEIVAGGWDQAIKVYDVADGSTKWEIDVPSWVSCLATVDVTWDGRQEVLVGLRDGTFRVLDGSDGYDIWEYRFDKEVLACAVGDVANDGNDYLVVGGEDGLLTVFSAQGALVHQLDVGSRVLCLAVADVDGDGAVEVVVGCGDNQLRVFENPTRDVAGMRLKWRAMFEGTVRGVRVVDCDGDGVPEILTAGYDKFVRALRDFHFGEKTLVEVVPARRAPLSCAPPRVGAESEQAGGVTGTPGGALEARPPEEPAGFWDDWPHDYPVPRRINKLEEILYSDLEGCVDLPPEEGRALSPRRRPPRVTGPESAEWTLVTVLPPQYEGRLRSIEDLLDFPPLVTTPAGVPAAERAESAATKGREVAAELVVTPLNPAEQAVVDLLREVGLAPKKSDIVTRVVRAGFEHDVVEDALASLRHRKLVKYSRKAPRGYSLVEAGTKGTVAVGTAEPKGAAAPVVPGGEEPSDVDIALVEAMRIHGVLANRAAVLDLALSELGLDSETAEAALERLKTAGTVRYSRSKQRGWVVADLAAAELGATPKAQTKQAGENADHTLLEAMGRHGVLPNKSAVLQLAHQELGMDETLAEAAFQRLKQAGAVFYSMSKPRGWMVKGTSATATGSRPSDAELEADQRLLEVMRGSGVIPTKAAVLDLARREGGLDPRHAEAALERLKKVGLVRYSRSKPKGWSVVD